MILSTYIFSSLLSQFLCPGMTILSILCDGEEKWEGEMHRSHWASPFPPILPRVRPTDNWWLITSQTRADVRNILFPTFCRCGNPTQGLKCIAANLNIFLVQVPIKFSSQLYAVILHCNPILFLFSQVSQKWAHSWGLPRLWLPSLQEGGKGNSSSAQALFTTRKAIGH